MAGMVGQMIAATPGIEVEGDPQRLQRCEPAQPDPVDRIATQALVLRAGVQLSGSAWLVTASSGTMAQ
jgi:hypothetical protein